MIIPQDALNAETLEKIIEEFVLREGTEYGDHDVSMQDKIAQVKLQLKAKTALLVYSELHESVNIVPKDQYVEDDSYQSS